MKKFQASANKVQTINAIVQGDGLRLTGCGQQRREPGQFAVHFVYVFQFSYIDMCTIYYQQQPETTATTTAAAAKAAFRVLQPKTKQQQQKYTVYYEVPKLHFN